MRKSTVSLSEAAVVSAICFGLFIIWSVEAVLDGFPEAKFNDSGTAWMIGLELVLGAAALLYLRARNFDIQSLYPHPTLRGSAIGVGLFLLGWVVGIAVTSAFASECARRPNFDHQCRLNIDQGWKHISSEACCG